MAKWDHNGQPVADASTSTAAERGYDEASEGMPLKPKLPAFDVATTDSSGPLYSFGLRQQN